MDGRLELTPREVARLLGVSLTRVYQLIHVGRLPGRKAGGIWLVRLEAALAEKHKRDHDSER